MELLTNPEPLGLEYNPEHESYEEFDEHAWPVAAHWARTHGLHPDYLSDIFQTLGDDYWDLQDEPLNVEHIHWICARAVAWHIEMSLRSGNEPEDEKYLEQGRTLLHTIMGCTSKID